MSFTRFFLLVMESLILISDIPLCLVSLVSCAVMRLGLGFMHSALLLLLLLLPGMGKRGSCIISYHIIPYLSFSSHCVCIWCRLGRMLLCAARYEVYCSMAWGVYQKSKYEKNHNYDTNTPSSRLPRLSTLFPATHHLNPSKHPAREAYNPPALDNKYSPRCPYHPPYTRPETPPTGPAPPCPHSPP